MKKGLSLLLAASVAFSAFSATAFAATPQTAQEKYEALVEAGIFEGFPDGQAHLDQNMTRAQAAKIVAMVLELDQNAAASSIYKDLADAEWAKGFIGAATAAGILEGRGNGIFDPSADVTIQELAKIMVEALDIEVDATATAEGADEWAQAYVAAAVAANLIPAQSDYTKPASRTILVEASFSAYEAVKKEEVAEVTLKATATGAKKISVDFGAAVDTSKVAITVKKGSVPVNISKTTFSEDKKSAVVELAVNLTKGDYTVTATGAAAEALTSSFTAEDEKVTKIELSGDTAAAVLNNAGTAITGAKIGFRVYNQYNEDITSKPGVNVNWNTTLGTVTTPSNGTLEITYAFAKDQTFILTGYVGTTTVSKQVKVGDRAYVNSINVVELYHKDGKELNTRSTFSQYSLIIEAKDQYGNNVTAQQLKDDVYYYSTNPSVADVNATPDNNNGKDSNKLGIDLVAPTGYATNANFEGSAVINFVPKFGGATVSFTVNVVKAAEVTSISLSYPSTVVGAGETVTIPFTAADQFGKEVTAFSQLDGKVTLTPNDATKAATDGYLRFEQNAVTGDAVLKYTAPNTKGNYIAMAVPKVANPSPSQLILEIKDAKKTEVIANYKGEVTALAVDAEATIKASDVVALDQYGLEVSADKLYTDYNVRVSVSDSTEIALNNANAVVFTGKNDTLTVKAKATGTQVVVFELAQKGTNAAVANTQLERTFSVVSKADIADYEVGDIKTIYGGNDRTNDHNVSVSVHGKLASGEKVVLPSAAYSVTSSVYGVTFSGGKLVVNTTDLNLAADKEAKGIAVVIIDANGGTKTVNKDVTVTTATRKITTVEVKGTTEFEMKDGAAVVAAGDVNLTNILKLFNAKDQYGVGMSIGNPLVSFANLKDKDGDNSLRATTGFTNAAGTGITGVEAGDTFEVTLVTANGIVTTVKVVVKLV